MFLFVSQWFLTIHTIQSLPTHCLCGKQKYHMLHKYRIGRDLEISTLIRKPSFSVLKSWVSFYATQRSGKNF